MGHPWKLSREEIGRLARTQRYGFGAVGEMVGESAFHDGYKACQKRLDEALDDLVAQYPKEGKWDDALSVWAYGKGFEAGLAHRGDECETS